MISVNVIKHVAIPYLAHILLFYSMKVKSKIIIFQLALLSTTIVINNNNNNKHIYICVCVCGLQLSNQLSMFMDFH